MTRYDNSKLSTHEYFWLYQLNAHGSCFSTMDPMCLKTDGRSIYSYFSTGLRAFDRLDVQNSLSNYSIIPSNTRPYHLHELTNAAWSAWGKSVQFLCITDPENGSKNYLFEIRFKYNIRGRSELELQDNHFQMCPNNKPIWIPK